MGGACREAVSIVSHARPWTTHVHPDGSVIATVKLRDGRVLRVVGARVGAIEYRSENEVIHAFRDKKRKQEPCAEP